MTGTARPDAATDDGRPSRLERAVDRVPFLEKELFLLAQVIEPGMTCIDVGAAGGAHLLVMAKAVGPTGRVLGIEPRPRSLRAVGRLARLAGVADRTRLLPIALAEAEGELPLRIPMVPTRAHLPGTTIDLDRTAAFSRLPHRELSVRTRRLDDIVAEEGLGRVDVVKIDVEGAELAALAGAHRTLERHRPLVLVEADDLHQARYEATAQDVLDAVTEHGYDVFRYRRGALDALDGGVVGDEDDYVLVPSERQPPLVVRQVEVPQDVAA
ncbi:FkbM family methyltransferase [Nitriliruptor alkaliphilus]|uniref:FkbM family methyltransferase n=1 Tax=Nitriliruptor alkaliphilus TaxID=427918 RepID=UPI0006977FC5|nr:FkbM family methyltransferase [Nitriliruptor alkaliphilus]